MTTKDLAATMMVHHSYSHGRLNVIHGDLTRLVEAWPDLLPVFEELQFLREENERLEDEVERLKRDVEVG